jgi:hypothetical protein
VFFPEGLIAAFLVLAAPFWALRLLFTSQYLQALVLLVGVAAFGYGAYIGFRKNEKWLAYAATVGLLGVGAIVVSWN